MSFDLKVGVAGCGRMGLGMARAMAAAGLDVTGFDVRPVLDFGGFADRMVADVGAFVLDRQVILSVVRDIAQTEALLFDTQAILSKAPALRYLVVCSTLSPRYFTDLVRRVPEQITVIDAPMSGAQISADEARLSFMLGGDPGDLDRLDPMFRTMGPKIHRMGPSGSGMKAKVLNNFVAGTAAAAVRKALGWAGEMDLDRARLMALMHDSSGQTWFGSNFYDIEFSRDGYDPGNTVGILKKDLESCMDAVDPADREGLAQSAIDEIAAWRPLNE